MTDEDAVKLKCGGQLDTSKDGPKHSEHGTRMGCVGAEQSLGDAVVAWEKVTKDVHHTSYVVFHWNKRGDKLKVYREDGHKDDSAFKEVLEVCHELVAKKEPFWAGYSLKAVHDLYPGQIEHDHCLVAFLVDGRKSFRLL